MKKIGLFFSALLLFSAGVLSAQSLKVAGTVTDKATGEGIPYAAVMVKGTMIGNAADADGVYTLNVSDPSTAILVFSAVGYHTAEIPLNNRASLNMALEADNRLDETIVIAYGTATRSSFTGSASAVKAETIEKKLTNTVTNALSGTTSGVQVLNSSGDPAGGTPTIRIRGIGSMSASNSPLIVLDGVPYDGTLSDINPQDVADLTVLKDASASAIYGARGANGVVLITTKRGEAGDAVVKFDARWGVSSRLIPNYDVITDPGQYYEQVYLKLYNSYMYSGNYTKAQAYARANANLLDANNGGVGYLVYTLPAGENLIGTNFKLNPNATLGYSDGEYYYIPDDWYDEIFRNSFRQEYNVSVSGASNRFNYYASAGYLDDGGIVSNSQYRRWTGRINAEYQAKDWMKFLTQATFSHSNSQSGSGAGSWGSSGNLFYIANNIAPIYPLYVRNADGSIMYENGRIVYDANQTNFQRTAIVGNAAQYNEYDRDTNLADVLSAKMGVVLTPIYGLSLTATVGLFDDNTRYNKLYSVFGSGSSYDGAAYTDHSRTWSINQQYLAEYKRSFGLHSIDVMGGFEQYDYAYQTLYGFNTNLFDPNNGELSNADGKASMETSSSSTYYKTKGFLGRVQYDYAERYYVNASVRRDASSRFAPGHQWGTFWSLGGAWLINKEDWFNSNLFDLLKFKISYGQQGNDNLGMYYPYTDQYTHSYNEDTGEYSLSLSYKGNEDITWETSKSFNVGFDFDLRKNILSGTLEFFTRKTEDLLYAKNVPYSSGNPVGYIYTNVGSIRNTGVELDLGGSIINNNRVQWTWNFNATHYVNKILSLDESVADTGIKGSYYIYKVGGSLYEAYMYKYAGVDKETGQALYWVHTDEEYDDGGNLVSEAYDSTTATFDQATKYELGSVLPKVYGGFGTTLNAFGIDFSFQFAYQLGGKYYDASYQQLMWTQDNTGLALHKDVLKAWTPTNTDTDIPRWDGDTQVAQSSVDRFLVSSNYLSLNNVTLGYTFPKKWTERISIASLRLYVAGENMFVLSARKGLDPRSSFGLISYSSGTGTSSYTARRTITGGITLTF